MFYTRADIIALLERHDKAVERGLVAIYNRQTADERATAHTKHANGVGFSGVDARLGSYLAKWIQSGKPLTGKHLERGRRIARKYVGQLTDIANRQTAD